MNEEWAAVEERLPDEEVDVLVTVDWTGGWAEYHHPKVIPAQLVCGEWRDYNYRAMWLHWRITHWMPLPQPAADPAPVAAEKA